MCGVRHVVVCQNEGWTALHVACHDGHTEVVRLLLARGASPDQQTVRTMGCKGSAAGLTPSERACAHWLLGGGVWLVDRVCGGSAVPASPQESGASSLCIACEYGHTTIVEALLATGADVDRLTVRSMSKPGVICMCLPRCPFPLSHHRQT